MVKSFLILAVTLTPSILMEPSWLRKEFPTETMAERASPEKVAVPSLTALVNSPRSLTHCSHESASHEP